MIRNFLLLIFYLLLISCGQSVAVLGPALTIATTGNVQHALVSQAVNSKIKHQTGKNISDIVVDTLDQPLNCTQISSNELQEVFFVTYNDIDCRLK